MHNFALGLGESSKLRLLLVVLILLALLPFTIVLVIVLVIMMGQAAKRSKWSLEEWGCVLSAFFFFLHPASVLKL